MPHVKTSLPLIGLFFASLSTLISACASLPEKVLALCNSEYQARAHACLAGDKKLVTHPEASNVELDFVIYVEKNSVPYWKDNRLVCTKTFTSEDVNKAGGLSIPSLAEMEKLFRTEDLTSQPLACVIKKCKDTGCKILGHKELLNFFPSNLF